MKIFLSGPMTGLPNFNRAEFNDWAGTFMQDGHVVLNPAILPDGLEQDEYMEICRSMLTVCDTVYFLRGWQKSQGARQEMVWAIQQGKEIILE